MHELILLSTEIKSRTKNRETASSHHFFCLNRRNEPYPFNPSTKKMFSRDPNAESASASAAKSRSSRRQMNHPIFDHPLLQQKRERARTDADRLREESQNAKLETLLQEQRDILRTLAENARNESVQEAWLRFNRPPPTTVLAGRLRSFDSWPLSPLAFPKATPLVILSSEGERRGEREGMDFFFFF